MVRIADGWMSKKPRKQDILHILLAFALESV